MSQEFKLNFDALRKDDSPHSTGGGSQTHEIKNENYPSAGNARNICFALKSGEKLFLNYAYLVSCKLLAEQNKIELIFTTHQIDLKGKRLEKLFENLFYSSVLSLAEKDERYCEIESETESQVHEISIFST